MAVGMSGSLVPYSWHLWLQEALWLPHLSSGFLHGTGMMLTSKTLM